ncbi:unnamed protein product [Psylliodes chrysocephalus]|uniref:Poly(A) RNA polymerase mitochondrial-like central palm domain-containing protein n=1 Tax=Psylliodes chrysocephalus TaxID=3402493 RepID=A0A9P0CEZ5_9CUCU|nr:unnamed protein product [Psylliodes chrysocephala]
MEEINSLTPNSMLEILENGSYHLTNTFITTRDVINKISEFSNFFSSTGRIALINADPQEAQELVFLFFNLKKNIKSAISELGKGYIKKVQTFLCPDCEETITIVPGTNIWDSLQNHEHFESLFSNLLAGNLQVLPLQSDSSDEMESVPHNNNLHNGKISNEPTDSGIEQSEEQNEDSNTPEELPLGDNTFRFNFKLKYDPLVESVIYPDSFTSMSKYDQCPFICVQKNSPYRAICLLCCCDLLSTKRISKKQCLDHVLGNRHMRASCNPVNIENVRNFHEVFWNFDVHYQAHQVYFQPNNTLGLHCKLCNALIPNQFVKEHIQGDYHKNLVLKMFYQKCLDFYLLDVQVGCYGIKADNPVESPKKEKMERKREEKGERRQRTASNPSTSKDEPEIEHIIIPSLTISGKDIVKDLLPHRLHPHSKYFENYTSFIVCTLCNMNIGVNTKCLMKHILNVPHSQWADVKLPKFTFFCEICNTRFTDDINWEKHFTGGPNRHSKISKIRANKLREFECTTCNTIIYGDEVSLTRHRNKNSRRERKNEPKLSELVKDIFKSRERLETYATFLVEEANNTVTCMQRTMECCSRLEAVLKTSLEDCKAHPFGSRVSGLGNRESDLDLFLDTGDMYLGRKKQDSVSQCQIVKQVAGLLRKHKGEFEKIHEVPTARTPIVKLKHIGTQLECDLSFKHGLSVENTKFLRLCLDLQPISQQFILVLKKWSESNKLSEHITTYAIAILAIFYLQINGYLLSVKKIRELTPTPAPVIDGWETVNITKDAQQLMKNHVIPYEHTLPRLLKDFFAYYEHFNDVEDTVCPLLGRTIKRKLFAEPKFLPPEMESYVKQLNGAEPEQFRFMSPFCIQDPFDLSHNLTKACQISTLLMFKKLCQQSCQCLESL